MSCFIYGYFQYELMLYSSGFLITMVVCGCRFAIIVDNFATFSCYVFNIIVICSDHIFSRTVFWHFPRAFVRRTFDVVDSKKSRGGDVCCDMLVTWLVGMKWWSHDLLEWRVGHMTCNEMLVTWFVVTKRVRREARDDASSVVFVCKVRVVYLMTVDYTIYWS